MSKINEILYYIVENYPYKDELSKTRTTKMVYLADWESSIKYNHQITNIDWYFDHYGPYVSDVFDVAAKDSKLKIIHTSSAFGNNKELLDFTGSSNENLIIKLSKQEKKILDTVIKETKYFNWNDFIKYVYATYPIVNQRKYSNLDLPELAKEYKASLASS
ncbi:Panacea domain-containing protein [Rummeliibacillus sp. BSL5]